MKEVLYQQEEKYRAWLCILTTLTALFSLAFFLVDLSIKCHFIVNPAVIALWASASLTPAIIGLVILSLLCVTYCWLCHQKITQRIRAPQHREAIPEIPQTRPEPVAVVEPVAKAYPPAKDLNASQDDQAEALCQFILSPYKQGMT